MSQTCSIGILCRKALKSTRIGATFLFEGTDQCYSISILIIIGGVTGESEVAQMAILKKAAPAKEAVKRKPDFVVRAKVKDDVWVTIGAAWSAQLKDGVTGYSLKINTFPAAWNGDALMMPPLETEE
jgi:hypothetical protein